MADLPSPAPNAGSPAAGGNQTTDARKLFADITKKTPRDEASEKAFLASKARIARTKPTLAIPAGGGIVTQPADEPEADVHPLAGPTAGGTGNGMFYSDSFKGDWAAGTAIYWEIICPDPPGGNVNTFLYLTATNRSGKGVEAFVSYNGQDETYFKVFDWARYPAERKPQINIPFEDLANYLRTQNVHGQPFQVLPVQNLTYLNSAGNWQQCRKHGNCSG